MSSFVAQLRPEYAKRHHTNWLKKTVCLVYVCSNCKRENGIWVKRDDGKQRAQVIKWKKTMKKKEDNECSWSAKGKAEINVRYMTWQLNRECSSIVIKFQQRGKSFMLLTLNTLTWDIKIPESEHLFSDSEQHPLVSASYNTIQ